MDALCASALDRAQVRQTDTAALVRNRRIFRIAFAVCPHEHREMLVGNAARSGGSAGCQLSSFKPPISTISGMVVALTRMRRLRRSSAQQNQALVQHIR